MQNGMYFLFSSLSKGSMCHLAIRPVCFHPYQTSETRHLSIFLLFNFILDLNSRTPASYPHQGPSYTGPAIYVQAFDVIGAYLPVHDITELWILRCICSVAETPSFQTLAVWKQLRLSVLPAQRKKIQGHVQGYHNNIFSGSRAWSWHTEKPSNRIFVLYYWTMKSHPLEFKVERPKWSLYQ